MFGASRRIAVDIEEEIEPLPFILMPENKLRMSWNLVTLLLLLYTASFVPYRTAFIEETSKTLEVWEWVVDGLFMIDILVNFISAYENSDKNIEVRWKMICQSYISSWFLFDAMAVFPF
jgi:Ion transport protein